MKKPEKYTLTEEEYLILVLAYGPITEYTYPMVCTNGCIVVVAEVKDHRWSNGLYQWLDAYGWKYLGEKPYVR